MFAPFAIGCSWVELVADRQARADAPEREAAEIGGCRRGSSARRSARPGGSGS